MGSNGMLICALAWAAAPASPARAPLTLDQAVAIALAQHPAVREAQALEAASEADVSLAHAQELPRLDASLQLNRGTGNVLPGPFYAMPEVPAVTGPPSPSRFDAGHFGSALGLGAAWDLLGLEQRMAAVDAALREQDRAQAAGAERRLEVAFAAADAFIAADAAQELARTARAGLERAQVFATSVKALVDEQLKSRADLSRAQAEVALAQSQLARAEQVEAVARVDLARAAGVAGEPVQIARGGLAALPRAPSRADGPSRQPLLREAQAATAAAETRTRQARLEYLPRFDLVASLWLRGSGQATGSVQASPADGLVPSTPNWSVGAVVSFPVLELHAVRARVRAAEARAESRRAGYCAVAQEVQSQIDSAKAALDGAARVAADTPAAVQAAREAEAQANARYRAGLGSALDEADAQRLLVQAEGEDALARLGVWRAHLLLARALGDLDPFLSEVRSAGGGR